MAFFRPNLKNLASFQVGWPKEFLLTFWPFFGPISSLMAFKNSFDFWLFFGLFTLKWIPMRENYYSVFFGNTVAKFL